MNKILLLLSLLISSSCFAEPENRIQIFDEYRFNKFIKILSGKNIPHTVTAKDTVYYPVSYSEQISKVSEEIFGKTDNTKKGVSVKKTDAPILATALLEKDISFKVNVNDKNTTFTWGSYYHDKAMKVVSDVIH